MRVETWNLLAIAGMALVTYATRAGGFWLMNRVEIPARFESWLFHLPGSILAAITAPMILASDSAGIIGVIATATVAVRTRSLLSALLVGVGLVCILRILFDK